MEETIRLVVDQITLIIRVRVWSGLRLGGGRNRKGRVCQCGEATVQLVHSCNCMNATVEFTQLHECSYCTVASLIMSRDC